MTASETTSSRSTFGWLPKLILWGIVIAFGYLYLSSIDRQSGDSSPSFLETISKLSPIPISALPGMGSKSTPAAESQVAESQVNVNPAPENPASKTPDVVQAPAEKTQAQAQDTHPVNQAESAVFANSLMNTEREAEQAPAAVPQAQAVAQQAPAAVTAPLAPTSPKSASALPEPRQPQAAVPYDYDWDAMARQQASIQAHYEAMRREADERMRQYWEHMRASAPVAMPYGYPGYPSGYAPGVSLPQQ